LDATFCSTDDMPVMPCIMTTHLHATPNPYNALKTPHVLKARPIQIEGLREWANTDSKKHRRFVMLGIPSRT